MMEKRVLVGVLLVLSILAAGNAFAATIHVSLPTYVTVNDKYDRNPSPFFSAGNYWVFYTKADSATGIRSGNYLDKDKYVIYYKTASTVEGLNAAPEIRIDPSAPPTRPAGFSQRVASGIVFDDGDILVVTSNGRDNSTDDHLYTYSYDSATATWSGPSQIVTTPWGTTGGHVRTAYNGATIYLVLQGTDDQSYIIKSTNRGATWTSPVLISSDNQPSIATYGGVLYVASIGDTSPMPIRLHKSIDDGATWTYVSDVNGLVDFYDPAVFFLNGALTVAFAPYNEPPKDRQYLVISRSPDSGLTWSSEKYVTNGGYGSNYWWDFWPAALSDGTNTYLFYTSEKSGQAMGDADIAFLKLDWNVEENHFEAIQPAVDYASNGDTISVAPGTYIETIKPASKDGLTIIGDATNKPIVDAGINFANTGDINGITFENLILKGNTFPGASPDIISMENSGAVYDLKINNCVFDGGKVSGKMGMVGENLAGTFTITNNEFKDIWGWAVLDVDDDATPPSGRNTLVFTDVILSNNNIHDCDGSIALRGNDVTRTQHVTVNGNTWSNIGGHGTENSQWAALEANHADSLIVHDNTVEGVKQGDGGEGQAFQFWDIGTIDFHDNTIKNNYQGVYFFGGSHIDPCGGPYALPSGSLYNNNIFGNTMYGLSVEATNTGGPLNAERNWWGDFSGPYNAISNSAGAGNAVSDNVDFDPWLCESAPSIWDTFNEKCDKDHDGYAATGYGGDDCKDNDPAINSGATETCNSIDDNCNNLVDEASNANDCKGTCEIYYAGSGYVWTGNGGAFNCCGNDPGEAGPYEATETTCDGRDNDCNGQIDEGLLTTYFKDNDGDTYGDPANSVQACTQPAGYVARAGDCVDTNDLVNPGMTETCNGIDDNCDGVIDEEGAVHCVNYYQDGDGDTYGTSSVHCYCAPTGVYTATRNGDCVDTNDLVNPGAAEVCDGLDNNCDGQVDEENALGCTTYHYDGDGDTYGITDNKCLCAKNGYYTATVAGDCNDANDQIHPGVIEICNGVDDNCDSQVDEGVLLTFYRDADTDTYGDLIVTTQACSVPAGYVADNHDCNDLDKDVNPGVTERCNGIDDDCDGVIDEEGAVNCVNYYQDGDGDTYGTTSIRCYCAPTGIYTATQSGDCVDTNDQINPGAAEICDGVDNNCNSQTDEGFTDTDHDGIADCVDPDIDGDGIDNGHDNCQYVANTNQADMDHDGLGDVCDPDIDGDGIPNTTDPFPTRYNMAPKTQITAPDVNSWHNGPFAVTLTDSDADGVSDLPLTCEYSVWAKRDSGWTATTPSTPRVCSSTITINCPTEGYDYCEIHASAKDKWNAQNSTGKSAMRLFSLDWTGPNLRIVKPLANAIMGDKRQQIEAAINDRGVGLDLNSVRLYIDGTKVTPTVTATSVKYTPTSDLSETTHTIKVEANDSLRNHALLEWKFTVDTTKPAVNILAPSISDKISQTQKVVVETNEIVKKISGKTDTGRAFTLCTNCDLTGNTLVFDEGINTLTATAEDYAGNLNTAAVSFFIDSHPPQILNTLPDNGVTIQGSIFIVRYTEDNLKKVILHWRVYSPLGPEQTTEFTGCLPGKNMECSNEVSMKAQDGKTIQYWFELQDGVNTPVLSSKKLVNIDSTKPVITIYSPTGSLFNKASVNLGISLSEAASLTYTDNGRAVNLCTSCDGFNGARSFSEGSHTLIFKSADKAGNKADEKTVTFTIDTTKPVIISVSPTNGYTAGTFSVQYTATDLATAILHYGSNQMEQACTKGTSQTCTFSPPVTHGNSFDYYFELKDTAGNIATSSKKHVTVDTVKPTFPVASLTPSKGGISFNILLSEKVNRLSYNAGAGDKLLCVGCNAYNIKQSFAPGAYTIVLKAEDYAGNSNTETRLVTVT